MVKPISTLSVRISFTACKFQIKKSMYMQIKCPYASGHTSWFTVPKLTIDYCMHGGGRWRLGSCYMLVMPYLFIPWL